MIDTTATTNVTSSVVTCHTCKQPIQQAEANLIGLLAPTGIYRNGREILRVTGETMYKCDTCFLAETQELPKRLTLAEDGEWEMPSWSRNPDDEEWITYGWRARTYEGTTFVNHKEKAIVQRWLADHGYIDTGDGHHYEQK